MDKWLPYAVLLCARNDFFKAFFDTTNQHDNPRHSLFLVPAAAVVSAFDSGSSLLRWLLYAVLLCAKNDFFEAFFPLRESARHNTTNTN